MVVETSVSTDSASGEAGRLASEKSSADKKPPVPFTDDASEFIWKGVEHPSTSAAPSGKMSFRSDGASPFKDAECI